MKEINPMVSTKQFRANAGLEVFKTTVKPHLYHILIHAMCLNMLYDYINTIINCFKKYSQISNGYHPGYKKAPKTGAQILIHSVLQYVPDSQSTPTTAKTGSISKFK